MINWFKRIYRKFLNALHGFWIIIKEENSLWVHFFVSFVVIIFGIIFELSIVEWAIIITMIGLVIGFEIFNTAIEYLVDIVSFEYNVKAKKIKDVAATATLFITLIAVIVGLIIFIPAIQDSFADDSVQSMQMSYLLLIK
ncbi:MAG: diacylglycerol kinase [Candidatus Hepatoplasma scabrum]|nr:MAG: diacylglycerol kinase [Candidatus Hepatoplasma sp.]